MLIKFADAACALEEAKYYKIMILAELAKSNMIISQYEYDCYLDILEVGKSNVKETDELELAYANRRNLPSKIKAWDDLIKSLNMIASTLNIHESEDPLESTDKPFDKL